MGGSALHGSAEQARCGMELRQFFEVRAEERDEWLVLDGKRHPPRVICKCHGWNASKNAALIVGALEAHNSELYSKFPSTVRFNPMNSPPSEPGLLSGEAKSAPTPKPATRKSRAGPGLGGDSLLE